MTKKIILSLAVYILLSGSGLYAFELVDNYYIESGKKLFEEKNYDDAVLEFQKALLSDPDNEEAQMYMRLLGYGNGRGEQEKPRPRAREASHAFKQETAQSDRYNKTSNKKHAGKSALNEKNTQCPGKKKDVPQAAAEEIASAVPGKENVSETRPSPDQNLAETQAPREDIPIEQIPAGVKNVQLAAVYPSPVLPVGAPGKMAITPPVEPVQVSGPVLVNEDISQDQTSAAKNSSPAVNQDVSSVAPATTVKETGKMPDNSSKMSAPVSTKPAVDVSSVTPATTVKETGKMPDNASKTPAPVPAKPSVKTPDAAPKTQQVALDESSLLRKPENGTINKISKSLKSVELTDQERKEALLENLRESAKTEQDRIRQKFAADETRKVRQVHAKFQSRGIGKKEKTYFRDINGDGTEERISASEKKSLDQIHTKIQREEQSALKKAQKSEEKKEKTELRKLDAELAKSAKSKKKGSVSRKAGQIIKNSPPAETSVKPEAESPENDFQIPNVIDDVSISTPAKAGQSSSPKQVSKTPKSAAKPGRAQQSSAPLKNTPEPVVLPEEVNVEPLAAILKPADQKHLEKVMAADPVVKKAVNGVKTQNTVLKKKLVSVVDMSQQDQMTIKDLESSAVKQGQKVEVLENDLVETQQTLQSKKEALKQQGERLKNLQTKISALEADVHSKQFDFKDRQLEYEKKLQAIEEEFGNYKTEKAVSEDDIAEQLKILKEALAKKITELNAAQEKLIFTENKLKKTEAEHAQSIKQYEELKKTLSDLEGRLSGIGGDIKKDEPVVYDVNPKNLPPPRTQQEAVYQQWIQRHDKLVTKLKDKLLWARDQMEYLGQYDIKLSDQKMAVLKEQLAAVKQQLSDQDTAPGRAPGDYKAMEDRLKDAQERLEMVEKILREKDDQIKELEKQINGVLSNI